MRPEVKEKAPDPDQNNPAFAEYFALSPYHRRCLDTTNYWSVINGGKTVIAVPPSDKRYHKYFDSRCYAIRKEKEEKSPSTSSQIATSQQPTASPIKAQKSKKLDVVDGFCVCKISQSDRKYKKVGLEWHCFYCGKSFDPDSLYGASPTDSSVVVVNKLKATKAKPTKPIKPTNPELF